MVNPRLTAYIVAVALTVALVDAGSATVVGCADYGIALGNGPSYYVSWMTGTINYLVEYNNYGCGGSNISDGHAWFYVSNYASRLIAWRCISVSTPWTLEAAGSDPWQMIAHGFFGPFVVNYDYQEIYRYLGYCEASNVVYSYYIRATLVWP